MATDKHDIFKIRNEHLFVFHFSFTLVLLRLNSFCWWAQFSSRFLLFCFSTNLFSLQPQNFNSIYNFLMFFFKLVFFHQFNWIWKNWLFLWWQNVVSNDIWMLSHLNALFFLHYIIIEIIMTLWCFVVITFLCNYC